ncbi:hypothetical protein GGS23DRAFT_563742 [Durotheca rogersii]|uniref:uncharacterized protein n=1 Tax=Durotheca rogersii TaxID=419775 RepID=UPI00221FC1F9|nr:uncharacterized protein GGS23DRAFT_563742 [Durotheca rogersii]KAI5864296.1 hypothetical protein GGS23DRAFT_563742 [Durotheca rogersii]
MRLSPGLILLLYVGSNLIRPVRPQLQPTNQHQVYLPLSVCLSPLRSSSRPPKVQLVEDNRRGTEPHPKMHRQKSDTFSIRSGSSTCLPFNPVA